jgi:hypothetical protein
MGKCKESAGVLYPHPCTRESSKVCSKCEKTICDLHTREVQAAVFCITCYKKLPSSSRLVDDPFLMAALLFPDYDTGSAVGNSRLQAAMTSGAALEDFEGDFDGT